MALSWGRPTIYIGALGAADAAPTTWIKLDTPVKDSTKLTPSAGEKLEAPLEGGGNADVKYSANTYVFETELYAKKGATKPVADVDGVIAGAYAIKLQPEDPTVEGIEIAKASVHVEDTWDSKTGAKWKYVFDVVKKDASTKQVDWKVIATPT
jgi:hypothetical protein